MSEHTKERWRAVRQYSRPTENRIIATLKNASDPMDAEQIAKVAHTTAPVVWVVVRNLIANNSAHIAAKRSREGMRGGTAIRLIAWGPAPLVEAVVPVIPAPDVVEPSAPRYVQPDFALRALMGARA